MRVVIVDDERSARARLKRLLDACKGVEVVGAAAGGVEALQVIASTAPDGVFLDVQMPDLTGFEVLAALPAERRLSVVFVTAYDRYALDAFEANAVDYLLKPVECERLTRAVARLQVQDGHAQVARLVASLTPGQVLQRIVGRRNGTFHVLPLTTIEAFVSDGDQVLAITAAERVAIDGTLRDLETRLSPRDFVRVHKQALVSLDQLTTFAPSPSGGATATLASGRTVPVSRRYAPVLRERLGCR